MNLKQAKIVQAFEFAYRHHAGTTRKGSQIPYIVHPMEVAVILLRNRVDEDVIVAGLLHDVIEEENVELKELEKQFGERVAQLVDSATEPAELRKGDGRKAGRKENNIRWIISKGPHKKKSSCRVQIN